MVRMTYHLEAPAARAPVNPNLAFAAAAAARASWSSQPRIPEIDLWGDEPTTAADAGGFDAAAFVAEASAAAANTSYAAAAYIAHPGASAAVPKGGPPAKFGDIFAGVMAGPSPDDPRGSRTVNLVARASVLYRAADEPEYIGNSLSAGSSFVPSVSNVADQLAARRQRMGLMDPAAAAVGPSGPGGGKGSSRHSLSFATSLQGGEDGEPGEAADGLGRRGSTLSSAPGAGRLGTVTTAALLQGGADSDAEAGEGDGDGGGGDRDGCLVLPVLRTLLQMNDGGQPGMPGRSGSGPLSPGSPSRQSSTPLSRGHGVNSPLSRQASTASPGGASPTRRRGGSTGAGPPGPGGPNEGPARLTRGPSRPSRLALPDDDEPSSGRADGGYHRAKSFSNSPLSPMAGRTTSSHLRAVTSVGMASPHAPHPHAQPQASPHPNAPPPGLASPASAVSGPSPGSGGAPTPASRRGVGTSHASPSPSPSPGSTKARLLSWTSKSGVSKWFGGRGHGATDGAPDGSNGAAASTGSPKELTLSPSVTGYTAPAASVQSPPVALPLPPIDLGRRRPETAGDSPLSPVARGSPAQPAFTAPGGSASLSPAAAGGPSHRGGPAAAAATTPGGGASSSAQHAQPSSPLAHRGSNPGIVPGGGPLPRSSNPGIGAVPSPRASRSGLAPGPRGHAATERDASGVALLEMTETPLSPRPAEVG
ncbi:hypothetical protein HYH03_006490 [Edaphochlamys debaryana]|uniref:Uncharacterized protein n=1 Tax=Edaphochlamys debaryana TaxID=47281 RepID=A0A835Y5L7_9CHLO|nr:hypothetical protein HYH03_006490 [Edaphochlamys debaryana]|eukprot:KAG2495547.1 hypothetical protein HYH03_006490 [Edaphochlamys debaryana]